MTTPLHAMIIHFPLALSFVLPFLMVLVILMMKKKILPPAAWTLIFFLQATTVITGYVALETGEDEEKSVELVVEKKYIQAHEEMAEIFVGLLVISCVIGFLALFIAFEYQIYFYVGALVFLLCANYFGYQAGNRGGELVYQHGANKVYVEIKKNDAQVNGLLPTPGMNTSESPFPVNDENDYNENDETDSAEVSDEED